MKQVKSIAFAITLVLGLCLAPIQARSQDITSMVANAKTTSDHEAIAKHYDEVAADLNAKAKEHDDLITTYSNQPRSSANDKHCTKMISDLRDGAKQASALAAAHRKMAAEAK